MEASLNELLIKCVNNGLNFWYHQSTGTINIFKNENGKVLIDERGCIHGSEYQVPAVELRKLHIVVDEFLLEASKNE